MRSICAWPSNTWPSLGADLRAPDQPSSSFFFSWNRLTFAMWSHIICYDPILCPIASCIINTRRFSHDQPQFNSHLRFVIAQLIRSSCSFIGSQRLPFAFALAYPPVFMLKSNRGRDHLNYFSLSYRRPTWSSGRRIICSYTARSHFTRRLLFCCAIVFIRQHLCLNPIPVARIMTSKFVLSLSGDALQTNYFLISFFFFFFFWRTQLSFFVVCDSIFLNKVQTSKSLHFDPPSSFVASPNPIWADIFDSRFSSITLIPGIRLQWFACQFHFTTVGVSLAHSAWPSHRHWHWKALNPFLSLFNFFFVFYSNKHKNHFKSPLCLSHFFFFFFFMFDPTLSLQPRHFLIVEHVLSANCQP